MITIWDEQLGKLVSGYVQNVTRYTFELHSAAGEKLGVFDVSMLKGQKSFAETKKEYNFG
jgi:hypothetical protein